MKRLGITFDIFVLVVAAAAFVAILWQAGQWFAPLVEGWNSEAPPPAYRGPVTAGVAFISPAAVHAACAEGLNPPAGIVIIACARATAFGEGVIIMPDPCEWADTEYYAKIQCHENAHLRGWHHG